MPEKNRLNPWTIAAFQTDLQKISQGTVLDHNNVNHRIEFINEYFTYSLTYSLFLLPFHCSIIGFELLMHFWMWNSDLFAFLFLHFLYSHWWVLLAVLNRHIGIWHRFDLWFNPWCRARAGGLRAGGFGLCLCLPSSFHFFFNSSNLLWFFSSLSLLILSLSSFFSLSFSLYLSEATYDAGSGSVDGTYPDRPSPIPDTWAAAAWGLPCWSYQMPWAVSTKKHPSIHPSKHPSIHQNIHPSIHPKNPSILPSKNPPIQQISCSRISSRLYPKKSKVFLLVKKRKKLDWPSQVAQKLDWPSLASASGQVALDSEKKQLECCQMPCACWLNHSAKILFPQKISRSKTKKLI